MRRVVQKFSVRLRSKLVNLFMKDDQGFGIPVICVIGSARSGTTLLAEAINCESNKRIIFEPCIKEYTSEFPFSEARSIALSEQNQPELKQFFNQVLKGELRNPWIDHQNTVRRPKGRIIKEVRMNLMLPWFIKQYDDIPILYIWRNPYDVVSSRISLGWSDHLEALLKDMLALKKLYPDIFENINFNGSSVYKQTLFWCLENKWALTHLPSLGIPVISFDTLMQNPLSVLREINKYTGSMIEEQKFINRLLIPSQSTRIKNKKHFLTKKEKDEIDQLIRLFQMEDVLS